MSDDPVPRDLVWDWSPHGVVVSSCGDGAFFCRPGDDSWRPLPCGSSAGVSHVTYCDGAFYLFDGQVCRTTVVDAETLAAAVIEPPAVKLPSCCFDFEANLVVSLPGELLLLIRTQLLHPWWHNSGKIFKAFRFHVDGHQAAGEGKVIWSEVTGGIGDCAVFVDHFRAFCVEANGLNGVRRNCIYVASSYPNVKDLLEMEEFPGGQHTVSVLNLDDLTTKNLEYGNLRNVYCNRFWQWPSWLLSNPH